MQTTQEAIAKAIRVRMARTGQSVADVATAAGKSSTWLSNRFAGRTAFDANDVDALAVALGLGSGFDLLDLAAAEADTAEAVGA